MDNPLTYDQTALWHRWQIHGDAAGQLFLGYELNPDINYETLLTAIQEFWLQQVSLTHSFIDQDRWKLHNNVSPLVEHIDKTDANPQQLAQCLRKISEQVIDPRQASLLKFIILEHVEGRYLLMQAHSCLMSLPQAWKIFANISQNTTVLPIVPNCEQENKIKAFKFPPQEISFASKVVNKLIEHYGARRQKLNFNWVQQYCQDNNRDLEYMVLTAVMLALKRFSQQANLAMGYAWFSEDKPLTVLALQIDEQQDFFNYYDRVVDQLKDKVSLHASLFQQNKVSDLKCGVNVFWQQAPDWHALTVEPYYQRFLFELPIQQAHDLEFQFCGHTLTVCYREQKFTQDWIMYFGDHVQWVLKQAVESPLQICAEQKLCPPELYQIYAKTQHPTQIDTTYSALELFEKQVALSPEKIAVSFNEHQLTYQELDTQAHQLALVIQQKNPKKATLIGIVAEQSLQLIIAMIAVQKAGFGFILIDPKLPKARLEQTFGDTEVNLALVEKHDEQCCCEQVLITSRCETGELEKNSQSMMYAVYTSGTEGQPKGIGITHKQFTSYLLSMQRRFNLSCDINVMSVTHSVFDVFLSDVFLALCFGGHVQLGYVNLSKPKRCIQQLQKSNCNYMMATPTVLSMLLEELPTGMHDMQVVSFGEILTSNLAKKLLRVFRVVWNMYGASETIFSTSKRLSSEHYNGIGYALNQNQLYILDKFSRMVPPYMPGVLYVTGIAVGNSYLNGDDEQQFSHLIIDGETKWSFKTNDLVYWHEDGNIEYICRVDQQRKIRGLRVDLCEIERIIERHPLIKHCYLKYNEQTHQLSAFYQPKKMSWWEKILMPSHALSSKDLILFVKKHCPDYMVPSAWCEIEEVPRTLTGKLDREALPDISLNTSPLNSDRVPKDYLEAQCLQLWNSVLPTQSVGMQDDFFEVGGYSIKAIKLCQLINQHFNLDRPVSWIYQYPTIRQQANQLCQFDRRDTYSPVLTYNPKQTSGNLFLIHPGLTGAEAYHRLAKQLSKEFGCFAIEYHNMYSHEEMLTSIEAHAALYLRYIKEIQPHGPYFIAGWSLGGLIGYEIAQQLLEQGEEVAKIYLLDVFQYSQKAAHHWQQVISVNFIHKFFAKEQVEHDFVDYLANLPEPFKSRIDLALKYSIKLYSEYEISEYPSKALLFWATQEDALENINNKKPFHGWDEYIKQLDVVKINSDHFDLMEPGFAEYIANVMSKDMLQIVEQTSENLETV